MNATAFTQQLEAMSNRLANLYQGIYTSSSLSLSLLPLALKELGIASERLEVAVQMLHQQHPLTHEDLGTACCTTRVSITRLLTQLQQQKKLSVDSQHHLILK